MSKVHQVRMSEFLEHTDRYDGICLACGFWTAGGVEPDAHHYACPACGARAVSGAEQALAGGDLSLTGTLFQCPECQRVSHNPHDADQRYCGACHKFFSQD